MPLHHRRAGLLVETVQKFAAERVTPQAITWSRESCVPAAVIEEVAALGLLGLELPRRVAPEWGCKSRFGGRNLGAGDAGLALGVLMHGIAGWVARLQERMLSRLLPAVPSLP